MLEDELAVANVERHSGPGGELTDEQASARLADLMTTLAHICAAETV